MTSAPGTTRSSRTFSLWRVVLAVVPLGIACAVIANLIASKIEATVQRQGEEIMLSWFEMTPHAGRRAQFSDADGNLVADTPSDTQSQLDPDRIVFSYAGGPAAEEERAAWTGFAEHLVRATDKPVDPVADSTTDQQLAAFSSGQLYVTGFNTGAVPLSVAAFGFVPICTHGTDEGAFGTTMQSIVPARTSFAKWTISKATRLHLRLAIPTRDARPGWHFCGT